MKRPTDTGKLARELASLPSLDREGLTHRWKQLYGKASPHYSSLYFLMHGIARRLQEQALGGLKPATRRLLMEAAGSNARPYQSLIIKPGTRLLREWHGVTHEVIVQPDGMKYNGKLYRSLSEIAGVITGNKWSGPLFFGLKKEKS